MTTTETFTGIDSEAEDHLLACVVMNPQHAVPHAGPIVSGRDFSDQRLGKAFDATVALFNAGRPVNDPSVLRADWLSMGVDPNIASVASILRLVHLLPNAGHSVYYAERIRDLARIRRIVNAASLLGDRARKSDANPDDVLGWLEGQVQTLRQGSTKNSRRVADVWDELITDHESRLGMCEAPALMSGLHTLDRLGFVFVPGELAILAARPGVGKTALSTQIGVHHARKGRTVLIASLEMRDKELASRILIPAAGYNHQVIRTNRMEQQCVDDLKAAKDDLGDMPLYIWSPGRVKVGAIHAQASVLKASHNLRLLIVDYVGLVKPDDSKMERREQVGEVVKSLREISQRLDIPVIALNQLNREAAKQRPTLANLSESGNIEQDADIVAFLYREKDDDPEVEFIMAKNRQGTLGWVPLKWHREQTRFDDRDARDMPNYNNDFEDWSNQ